MVMRWIVVGLLAVHGLIHLMGFAKAFGYAELPQLTKPISSEMGVAWLAAGLLVIASAVTMVASHSSRRRRSSCPRGPMRGRERS